VLTLLAFAVVVSLLYVWACVLSVVSVRVCDSMLREREREKREEERESVYVRAST
jgi:heme exporter protein D